MHIGCWSLGEAVQTGWSRNQCRIKENLLHANDSSAPHRAFNQKQPLMFHSSTCTAAHMCAPPPAPHVYGLTPLRGVIFVFAPPHTPTPTHTHTPTHNWSYGPAPEVSVYKCVLKQRFKLQSVSCYMHSKETSFGMQ